MFDNEEDDTHLCLDSKNYTSHRKQHCCKIVRNDSALLSVVSPAAEHQYEPSSQRADDFFSSLELQSIQTAIPNESHGCCTANKVGQADEDLEDAEDSDNDLYPPTSHTGGKWKPGWGPPARSDWKAVAQHREVPLRTVKEPATRSEEFICVPCNRRYSNSFSYLRHKETRYHLKRSGCILTGEVKSRKRHLALVAAKTAVEEEVQKHDGANTLCHASGVRKKSCSKCPSYSHDEQEQSSGTAACAAQPSCPSGHCICSNNEVLNFEKSPPTTKCSGMILPPATASIHAKQPFLCTGSGQDTVPVQGQGAELHCVTCNTQFLTLDEFSLHQCHFTVSEQAREQFLYSTGLSETALTHIPSDGPRQSTKEADMQKKHTSAPKLSCPHCKKLVSKCYMKLHMHRHTGEKPFVCSICDQHFSHRSTLNIHIKHHLGLRKFHCNQCNFRAVRRSMLRRHELSVHRPTVGLQPCTSPVANTPLRQQGVQQKSHNMRDQKLFSKTKISACRTQSMPKPQPYFICDSCSYKTTKRHLLLDHQRLHTGEQPFRCSQCDFKASRRSQVHRHSRIHFGLKPYSCPYCKYRCNNQENLRKHILNTKKHSGKQMYPCSQCSFACNEYKAYKKHVSDKHREDLTNNSHNITVTAAVENQNILLPKCCDEIANPPSTDKPMTESCTTLPEPAVFLTIISGLSEPDLEYSGVTSQALAVLDGLTCADSGVLNESSGGILLPSSPDSEFSDQLNTQLSDQGTFTTLDTTDSMYTACLSAS